MAQDLYGRLRQALEVQSPIVIEAAQVVCTDTAMLQLLCAFSREARSKGIALQWQQPSQALLNAARLIDLCTYLELPTVEREEST